MGADFSIFASGPAAYNSWGRLSVDFIREDGEFKIWHMVFAEDIHALSGTSWAEPFPDPNDKANVHELWRAGRPLEAFPAVPVPYDSFGETFSYGV